ncbi:MAG: hypothetical protein MUD10_01085 [Candidatus Pacebacteria bacterium]|nr:hypothetical protein [Candidatus Paceibacterota bacterium]
MLTIFVLFGLLGIFCGTAVAGEYKYNTSDVVRIIYERAGVLPAFNLTQKDLVDGGFETTIKDQNVSMPIYRLKDFGRVLNVTEYVPNWNRAVPVLYLLNKGRPLGSALANTTEIHVQSQVFLYNSDKKKVIQMVFNPWGPQSEVYHSAPYPFNTSN